MEFDEVMTMVGGLLGGLAFFLFGMSIMSSNLKKAAGGRLQQLLKKMTTSPLKSLAVGAGITVLIQSSSAFTVMLVGLVNSSLMQMADTIPMMMGSDIGTTFTAWITSLSDIEGTGPMALLKPQNFSPFVALIGVIITMVAKSDRKKDIGTILVGFAILMTGMNFMGNAVSSVKDSPNFQSMLETTRNPVIAVAVSTLFTGIIQSSAATIVTLQGISKSGMMTYEMALPLVIGANIGTCATALISSIGVTKNAKRVSVVHILTKVIGGFVVLCLFYAVNSVLDISVMDTAINGVGIAGLHTLFNVTITIILLPFRKTLEKLSYVFVREDEKDDEYEFIDDRLLRTPAFAVGEVNSLVNDMARLSKDTIIDAISILHDYDKVTAQKILLNEDEVDRYEDELGTFLVKLSSCTLSVSDSRKVSKYLHSMGDFERISDHAVNIVRSVNEIQDKDLKFSKEAAEEIAVLEAAITEILDITVKAYCNDDVKLAKKVEPLEEVIDEIIMKIKNNHINRLQKGNCTIEMGFVLNDILTNYERVSDHCSNIAVAIIEVTQGSFETHQYLHEVKYLKSESYRKERDKFGKDFDSYGKKYLSKIHK
ncbi:MAG: Na/Pi cotransporter family protein [Lachnospiraceae bacterium]|nr:Na/Pi cotransporter family protein [Lachnospiraceae bacterium]